MVLIVFSSSANTATKSGFFLNIIWKLKSSLYLFHINAGWIECHQNRSKKTMPCSELSITGIVVILLSHDLHRQHDLASDFLELHSLEVLVSLISLKCRDFLLYRSFSPYEELVSGAWWHGYIYTVEGRNTLSCAEPNTASPMHFTLSSRPDQQETVFNVRWSISKPLCTWILAPWVSWDHSHKNEYHEQTIFIAVQLKTLCLGNPRSCYKPICPES